MDDKLLKRIDKMILAAGDVVSPEEFVEAITALTEVIKDHKSSVDEEVASMKKFIGKIEQTAIKLGEKYSKSEEIEDSVSSLKSDVETLKSAPSVPDRIIEKTETIKEVPIVTENIVEVAMKDTPDETVDKVNKSSKKIRSSKIEGLERLPDIERMAKANFDTVSMPVTTSFFNGLRGKNLNIVGATATLRGDTVNVTPAGSAGSGVTSVVAGSGIAVDSTTPSAPIVSLNPVGIFNDVQFVAPASAVTQSNTTNQQSIFDAAMDSLTVLSNSTYIFDMVLFLTNGATNHITSLAFDGGTSVISSFVYDSQMITYLTLATIPTTISNKRNVGTAASVLNAGSTNLFKTIRVTGMFRVTTGGTFIPQIKYSADPTGTITTDVGSYIRVNRLGSETVQSAGPWT